MRLIGGLTHAGSEYRSPWHRITEPYVLFPLITVLLLGIIWAATIALVGVELDNARRTAAGLSAELAETYEAQTVRALREIDQALKLVKFAYESSGGTAALPGLKRRDLLPPGLVFNVGVADRAGAVIASTRAPGQTDLSGQDFFQAQHDGDSLLVGRPWLNPTQRAWKLRFSRRLDAPDGTFDGIALVEVDAAYFVSGYEASKLGEYGMLGILGKDGIFRARRTGDMVVSGETVDYEQAVTAPPQDAGDTVPTVSAWDGVARFTSARELFEFPLAVVVGLSADEQLAQARRQAHSYLWRAAAASGVLLLLMGLLGHMSWQLLQSRLRAGEEQLRHARQIEHIAYHDGLTALPNRSMFSKLLHQGISQAQRYNKRLAILFLDLDRFKQINDTLGHDAGDQLLREVASRLRHCLRESDTIARLGGDEFVALLPELNEDKDAEAVAHKILSAVVQPYTLAGHEFRVTTSIGISLYPRDGEDEQTLMKNADLAMYHAKEQGKNNFQFYSEQLNASSLERLALESSLRHALERNEFQLYYQAKRDLRSGRVTGMEALLRWQHPDLGTVAPLQFIPLAEETGLIVPIGRWVLRTACLQGVSWQRQGLGGLIMAINLSPRQFTDENLPRDIVEILRETGMNPHLLELEITESMLMHDIDKTVEVLTELKMMGIRIAIDDFGTGYSSLSTLRQFPLDTIKIDGSFIREIANNSEDLALTEAIIAMGNSLSLTVVAEGVETREQAELLRRHACNEFQGFYFNKPMPADEFTAVLRDRAGADAEWDVPSQPESGRRAT